MTDQKAKFHKNTHVALFLPNLGGGGAEKMMLHLAAELTKLGLNIDLVLVRAEGVYLSKIPPNVQIVNLKANRISRSLPGLIGYLRRERPNALLSALDLANMFAILSKYFSRTNTRVVVSVRSIISLYARQNLKKKLELRLICLSYRWSDGIVAISHGVAKDLSKTCNVPLSKIKVIYNPVITSQLIEQSRESVDHPFFQLHKHPIVLGAGRLTEVKDFPTLIRAFALVQKRVTAKLVILGEGEQRPQLESLVHDLGLDTDVSMPGFVDNPFAYMSKADVFVLSSAWEGFGNVLVEAMACGCPIVSTDCPSGPSEILDNGRYGDLVSVDDVEAMAQAILNVLSGNVKEVDPEWLNQFKLEPVAQQYLKVLGLSYS